MLTSTPTPGSQPATGRRRQLPPPRSQSHNACSTARAGHERMTRRSTALQSPGRTHCGCQDSTRHLGTTPHCKHKHTACWRSSCTDATRHRSARPDNAPPADACSVWWYGRVWTETAPLDRRTHRPPVAAQVSHLAGGSAGSGGSAAARHAGRVPPSTYFPTPTPTP